MEFCSVLYPPVHVHDTELQEILGQHSSKEELTRFVYELQRQEQEEQQQPFLPDASTRQKDEVTTCARDVKSDAMLPSAWLNTLRAFRGRINVQSPWISAYELTKLMNVSMHALREGQPSTIQVNKNHLYHRNPEFAIAVQQVRQGRCPVRLQRQHGDMVWNLDPNRLYRTGRILDLDLGSNIDQLQDEAGDNVEMSAIYTRPV